MRISGVYKIINTVTNDFYIGSSKDVEKRWADHKCPSTWKINPNKQLYKDMMKYGVEKFELQVITEVKPESLKEIEQQFIEKLKPTYNSNRANGWDIERYKERQKEYQKEYNKEYYNQLCSYNGETLSLNALRLRFHRAGIKHYTLEAKKYLLKQTFLH